MNATPEFGKLFYALHISEGIVAYPEQEVMLKLPEELLRRMDKTFRGKPVFRTGNKVTGSHVPTEVLQVLSESASKAEDIDGIVVRSFYNEADGKHWLEMLVWNEEALDQIQQGFGVSNAYVFDETFGPGGDWHAVPYDAEVIEGAYDHLLITNQPRYEESRILTPKEFAAYNEALKSQLAMVTNSKEAGTMEFFKREKATIKPEDILALEVKGTKSGKMFSIAQLVNEKDDMEEKKAKNEMPMADMTHRIKLDDNSMCNVGELMEKYKNALNTIKEWETESAKPDEERAENSEESEEEKKKREDKEKAENSKTEEEKKAEEKKAENEHKKTVKEKVAALRTANQRVSTEHETPAQSAFMSSEDKMARARELF